MARQSLDGHASSDVVLAGTGTPASLAAIPAACTTSSWRGSRSPAPRLALNTTTTAAASTVVSALPARGSSPGLLLQRR